MTKYLFLYHFSFLDNNRFIVPNFLSNNKIEILEFNYNNEPIFQLLANFTIKTSSSIALNPIKYLKCISTNNNIICGYIFTISIAYDYESLMIFIIDSNYKKTENIKIYEYKIESSLAIVEKGWLELIPLDNEKLIFCVLNGNKKLCVV